MEYRKDDSYALNIVDAEEIVTGGQTTKNNPLYVYETHSLSNDTYLVIRGQYKGEMFFYRYNEKVFVFFVCYMFRFCQILTDSIEKLRFLA